jgi:hypothetical protein
MFRVRGFSFLFGLISIMFSSQASAQTAVMKQFSQFGDAPFIVPRGDNARLSELDLSIHHGTTKPRKLLKNDGTIRDCCIVESVRLPQPEDAANNASYSNGTLNYMVNWVNEPGRF